MKSLLASAVLALILVAPATAMAQQDRQCQAEIVEEDGRMVAYAPPDSNLDVAEISVRWTPDSTDGLDLRITFATTGGIPTAQGQVFFGVVADVPRKVGAQAATLTVAFDQGPVLATVNGELKSGVSYNGEVLYFEGNLGLPRDAYSAAKSVTLRLLDDGGAELKRWTRVVDASADARRIRATLDGLRASFAEQRPCVPRITKPNWVRKPSGDAIAKVYPPEAAKGGVSGRVTLACQVSAEGRLLRCRVVSDFPEGAGFGDAALKLVAQFRMAPMTADGMSVAGASVRVPVVFYLP